MLIIDANKITLDLYLECNFIINIKGSPKIENIKVNNDQKV